jgi:hypothetical protein
MLQPFPATIGRKRFSRMTTLVADSVKFYSQGDERAFFSWLRRIKRISSVRGVGPKLLMDIDPRGLADADLREIIGLFHRYGVDKRQLGVLLSEKNAVWFRDDRAAFWHRDVFGKAQGRRS